MALEDIEKLKEKVAKDPNSKLFVPLADEYRKMGMLDDAITVLLKGLNNQPAYMSARVSLGKVYLEKKMLAEAKEEFEKVVSAIPDNLFAHKKLAEIYRDLGDKGKAISEYKAVLRLNSLDEDAVTNLEALQREDNVKEPEIERLIAEETHVLPTAEEELNEAEDEIAVLPEEEIPQPVHEDEFKEFKKSIDGRGEDAGEITGEDIILEETIEDAEEDTFSYTDIVEGTGTTDTSVAFEAILEEVPAIEKPAVEEEAPAAKLTDAELFISQGNYSKAMGIYRGILSSNPDDKRALQKIEELRMLLKMLGKDKETVIDKLEALKEGLKRKKNEFLSNT